MPNLGFDSRFLLFAAIGAVGTTGHYFVLVLLVETAHTSPVLGTGAGYAVGAIINYALNYRFTFRSRAKHHIAATKFIAVALVGASVNAAIVGAGIRLLSLHYLLAQLLATTLVVFMTFTLNKAWTFASVHSSAMTNEAPNGARNQNLTRKLLLAAIAIFYLAVPNARPDFTRFNCHDSESYLALAHNLAYGNGYTRSLEPGMYVPHKTWPPGVPVLLVPAAALSGDHLNWVAVKATMILVGLLGILATWFLVARITSRPEFADLAALIIALNPFYWDFSHQAMSEVPTIAFALGALLLVDRIFAGRRPGLAAVGAAGLVCGAGMLVRGNLCGLALVPLAYLVRAARHASNALP